jgi:hypothetical protein
MDKYYILNRIKAYRLRFSYSKPTKQELEGLIKSMRPHETNAQLIRLGGVEDGGYLVPNDLENLEACFSPGVGGRSNFEIDCAELGMKIFMADRSVDKPSLKDSRFNFIKKFIGGRKSKDFITLEDWVTSAQIEETRDLLLQMDIEGYEYEVLKATSVETLNKFRIIIIEFHMLTSLGYPYYYQRTKKALEKLLLNHTCVHIHPNNACGKEKIFGIEVPGVAEFTFLRNDRITRKSEVLSLPHPLDIDNSPVHDPLVLSKFWYRSK